MSKPTPETASSPDRSAQSTAARELPIAQVAGIVMLAWALVPSNPYGYYILLRVVMCGICLYLTWRAFQHSHPGWAWALAIIAVVYNPIFRIHLTREIWSVVNVATIIVLAMSIRAARRGTYNKSTR